MSSQAFRRQRGWEGRLAAEIEAARRRTFVWGTFDCALFAADTTLAMTGEDPAAWFRGRYKTARGAEGALRRFSDASENALEATLIKLFGEAGAPAFARRGDIVTVQTEPGLACGVVGLDGTVVHVVEIETGLVDLPRRLALKCWRVG